MGKHTGSFFMDVEIYHYSNNEGRKLIYDLEVTDVIKGKDKLQR